MNISTVFISLLSLIGSVRIIESHPSPRVLLAILTAFLLADNRSRIRLSLAFSIGMTALCVTAGGTISLAGFNVVLAAGIVAARPVQKRIHLDTALYVSSAILVALSLWAYITRHGEVHWLTLLSVAAGWMFSTRVARMNPSATLFRLSLIPPVIIMSFLMIFPNTNSTLSRDRDHGIPNEAGASGRIHELKIETTEDPWNPSAWNALGTEYLNHGDVPRAHHAFQTGWMSRPRKTNVCLHGLLATARKMGLWRRITELVLDGHVPLSEITGQSVIPVASELWRKGRDQKALLLLEESGFHGTFSKELAGWIAMDMGDTNTALTLLLPCAESMTSGETVFRTAQLLRRSGHNIMADTFMIQGATRFPHHMKLGSISKSIIRDSTLKLVGPDSSGLELGNAVRLLGWKAHPDTVTPGESFAVITEWIAEKPLLEMTMILHIDSGVPTRWRLNEDHVPCSGSCPTSAWPVGEVIPDTVLVRLPIDAPVGEMMLYTGLWVPGDPESRLLPEDTPGYLLPRGELRIPLGKIYSKTAD